MDRHTSVKRALVASLLASAMVGAPAAGQGEGPLIIDAFDLGFDPSRIEVAAPGTYSYAIENSGALAHDLTFPDGTTTAAAPGEQSDVVEVDVPASGLEYWCSVPGHREAGMEGVITVAGAEPSTGAPSGVDQVPGVDPDPGAPAPVLFDPTAPTRSGGDTHEFSMSIQEGAFTVAPGYQVTAWSFGGTIPGPTLRVGVGDQVTVRVSNTDSNEFSHSVDFHVGEGAPNDEMRPIAPGEERVYTFTAQYAGVYLYTGAGTIEGGSMLEEVANGLYGMVIVEPRGGLTQVGQELVLIQNEWFVEGQGLTASMAKASAGEPDFVTFNGVASQYLLDPPRVDVDQTVRLFLANAGPTQMSAFHIQGAVLSRVVTEGVELVEGNPGRWGSSTVSLAPGQGAIAEAVFVEDGRYPFFSHVLNQPIKGARGFIVAGTGQPG
jgi:nitrite reductase (NO-forming)